MVLSESKQEQARGMNTSDLEARRDSIKKNITELVDEYEYVVDVIRSRRQKEKKKGA